MLSNESLLEIISFLERKKWGEEKPVPGNRESQGVGKPNHTGEYLVGPLPSRPRLGAGAVSAGSGVESVGSKVNEILRSQL